MTDTLSTTGPRAPRCHYDRGLDQRVTREHREDCTTPDQHRGCAPCTAPHCRVCGREHLDNAHPQTCDSCVGKVRDDLVDIRGLCQQLRGQAAYADGLQAAAAPIPGAEAMVLIGPATLPHQIRISAHLADDHRVRDQVPPLAVLADWEDRWRTWVGHEPAGRASISRCVGYFDRQLTYLAQVPDGPDFWEFSRALLQLRVGLERALHDEREPDRGVECFECGDRLVRRHRAPKRCRHKTPARRIFEQACRYLDQGYPEMGPTRLETRAARVPCGSCSQGGIDDPRAGISWECPGCRKDYTPGEYATAVRRSLLDGEDADGWTDVTLAAGAASTLTGRLFPASTIRKWMDRGQVGAMCRWRRGERWGQRLVYWPDVAERATEPSRPTTPTRRAS